MDIHLNSDIGFARISDSSQSMDYSILPSILGSPPLWKLPYLRMYVNYRGFCKPACHSDVVPEPYLESLVPH